MSNYILRGVDGNNDWFFGNGLNSYVSNLDAVAQDVGHNLQMFLGDCFFARGQGIDWWNLLGNKDTTAVTLAINGAILGTTGVTGLLQTSYSLNADTRALHVVYTVNTVYSVLSGTYVFNVGTL